MKAEGEGKFRIATKLKHLLPEFNHTNKDTLTLKEILSHNGRLKAWIPFYLLTQDSVTKENLPDYYQLKRTKTYNIEVAKDLFLRTSFRDSIVARIKNVDQREQEGYKYSDLGYYILKRALEKRYKKPLRRGDKIQNMKKKKK